MYVAVLKTQELSGPLTRLGPWLLAHFCCVTTENSSWPPHPPVLRDSYKSKICLLTFLFMLLLFPAANGPVIIE